VLEEDVDDAESERVQEGHDAREHKEGGARGDVVRLVGDLGAIERVRAVARRPILNVKVGVFQA
jgi:hypothetical protein